MTGFADFNPQTVIFTEENFNYLFASKVVAPTLYDTDSPEAMFDLGANSYPNADRNQPPPPPYQAYRSDVPGSGVNSGHLANIRRSIKAVDANIEPFFVYPANTGTAKLGPKTAGVNKNSSTLGAVHEHGQSVLEQDEQFLTAGIPTRVDNIQGTEEQKLAKKKDEGKHYIANLYFHLLGKGQYNKKQLLIPIKNTADEVPRYNRQGIPNLPAEKDIAFFGGAIPHGSEYEKYLKDEMCKFIKFANTMADQNVDVATKKEAFDALDPLYKKAIAFAYHHRDNPQVEFIGAHKRELQKPIELTGNSVFSVRELKDKVLEVPLPDDLKKINVTQTNGVWKIRTLVKEMNAAEVRKYAAQLITEFLKLGNEPPVTIRNTGKDQRLALAMADFCKASNVGLRPDSSDFLIKHYNDAANTEQVNLIKTDADTKDLVTSITDVGDDNYYQKSASDAINKLLAKNASKLNSGEALNEIKAEIIQKNKTARFGQDFVGNAPPHEEQGAGAELAVEQPLPEAENQNGLVRGGIH